MPPPTRRALVRSTRLFGDFAGRRRGVEASVERHHTANDKSFLTFLTPGVAHAAFSASSRSCHE